MTAKKAAIYFLRRKTGLTNIQIGEIFNMTSAAVSMAEANFTREIDGDEKLKVVVDKIDCSFRV